MADQDQRAALRDIALALVVHLGDQRAGGVEHRQARASPASSSTLLRHAMRAEDRDGVGRDLGEVLDEVRALGLQAFDHVLVVHDLVAHIDRRAVFLERALDDLDRAHHAGAEAARLRQNDLHGGHSPSSFEAVIVGCFDRHAGTVRVLHRQVLAERLEHLGDDALGVEPARAYIAAGVS